jgi:hypothetical protein
MPPGMEQDMAFGEHNDFVGGLGFGGELLWSRLVHRAGWGDTRVSQRACLALVLFLHGWHGCTLQQARTSPFVLTLQHLRPPCPPSSPHLDATMWA